MSTRAHTEDELLQRLRAEFGGWRVWRSVKQDGRLGEWVATLHDPGVGVEPTLMFPTAEELREALVQQANMAGRRE